MKLIKSIILIIILLPTFHCINANLDNPCDIQSESFLNTFLVKAFIQDSTSHCGYSLQFNASPIKVIPSISSSDHNLYLTEDGKVKAWGLGSNGQLGYGNTNNVGDGAPGNLSIKDSPFLELGGIATQITAP